MQARLLLLVVCSAVLYRYVVYPYMLSPLSRIPSAHWSAPFSSFWVLYLRRRGKPNATIHALHQERGPVLRLAPNELSVNCVEGGIRTIYGGGYEKGDWYAVFQNYGMTNTFSSPSRAEHGAKKRMMSNVYAKSTLQTSDTLLKVADRVIVERLLPYLRGKADAGEEVEMYSLFNGAAMDFVTGYIFGAECGTDFLADPVECHRWVLLFKARQEFMFWPQELPGLTAWAIRLGLKRWLLPKWVDTASHKMEDMNMCLCNAAAAVFPDRSKHSDGAGAAVYNQLRSKMKKGRGQDADAPLTAMERKEIASELLDHVVAGFDTTGITLTYVAWELSKPEHQDLQADLRQEIVAAAAELQSTNTAVAMDFKVLENLPLLNAVVMESLRLHAAIPGVQPRLTPEAAELGPIGNRYRDIPIGVRVNSTAYSLHLNEDVFPDATQWLPSRWIDSNGNFDSSGEKAKWFWAFGSGGRMCIGSNLATIEMKSLVAAIWSNFTTSIVSDAGMVHNDGYTAEPMGTAAGQYLRLHFAAVDS